ncbi:hypothetical protein EMIHUDRAFT_443565 [Emiliania huxleyi CCMP1516]|uniref:Uncharacterized protein n=2 Tax=Emiliania huxleyi TaxID=2903 RepID=A0A0D3JQ58_EMIH1|nr:hypothetical protein EMIHUDRAFT_443565 [Emiliania huxleyi CCMP1516]EOD25643.1 hypothetical protein EMIHUDRAFT_443565 [Emiliania huxleyi CCMP1516]|eukprot:XP_005778072.1 hypothetical protein EMIHUDRAFT_443565 [Emiliania huxleyi CCMP1516]
MPAANPMLVTLLALNSAASSAALAPKPPTRRGVLAAAGSVAAGVKAASAPSEPQSNSKPWVADARIGADEQYAGSLPYDPWAHSSLFGLVPPPVAGTWSHQELVDAARGGGVASVQIAPQHDVVIAVSTSGRRYATPMLDDDFPTLLLETTRPDGSYPFAVLPMDESRAALRSAAGTALRRSCCGWRTWPDCFPGTPPRTPPSSSERRRSASAQRAHGRRASLSGSFSPASSPPAAAQSRRAGGGGRQEEEAAARDPLHEPCARADVGRVAPRVWDGERAGGSRQGDCRAARARGGGRGASAGRRAARAGGQTALPCQAGRAPAAARVRARMGNAAHGGRGASPARAAAAPLPRLDGRRVGAVHPALSARGHFSMPPLARCGAVSGTRWAFGGSARPSRASTASRCTSSAVASLDGRGLAGRSWRRARAHPCRSWARSRRRPTTACACRHFSVSRAACCSLFFCSILLCLHARVGWTCVLRAVPLFVLF